MLTLPLCQSTGIDVQTVTRDYLFPHGLGVMNVREREEIRKQGIKRGGLRKVLNFMYASPRSPTLFQKHSMRVVDIVLWVHKPFL